MTAQDHQETLTTARNRRCLRCGVSRQNPVHSGICCACSEAVEREVHHSGEAEAAARQVTALEEHVRAIFPKLEKELYGPHIDAIRALLSAGDKAEAPRG